MIKLDDQEVAFIVESLDDFDDNHFGWRDAHLLAQKLRPLDLGAEKEFYIVTPAELRALIREGEGV